MELSKYSYYIQALNNEINVNIKKPIIGGYTVKKINQSLLMQYSDLFY